MAAHDCVKVDPAFERWNQMREDVYKKFKWTKYTTRVGVMGLVVVPGLMYYLFAKTDRKYNWTAARKGEKLSTRD